MSRHFENPKVEGTEWRSHGHEPFVYRAWRVEDLLGVHAEVIASGLRPGEPLRYLLYSPIWDGRNAPFGISSQPASHALAVADDRFLISRNPHVEGVEPTLQVVPFDRVMLVEVGTAHFLGWFSIQFARGGQAHRLSILFASAGVGHFQAAVREYRTADAEVHRGGLARNPPPWRQIWERVPKPQVLGIGPLIAKGESALGVVRTSQSWGIRRRLWREVAVCLSCDGVLIPTNLGLIYAADEKPLTPESRSYAVNVSCLPRHAIAAAIIRYGLGPSALLGRLRLELRRAHVTAPFELSFDERATKRVVAVAGLFGLDVIRSD
jgi:hypothetical protein